MLRITCISGRLGTSSQVLFLIKALNSLDIALNHSGLDKASLGFFGIGTMVEVWRLKICLGLEMPDMARVRIERVGGGGGTGIGLVVEVWPWVDGVWAERCGGVVLVWAGKVFSGFCGGEIGDWAGGACWAGTEDVYGVFKGVALEGNGVEVGVGWAWVVEPVDVVAGEDGGVVGTGGGVEGGEVADGGKV
ncbi:hypothetical protein HanRHA438_Chr17g0804311 [Helianthus annuus]|nr:hypothetical protein HanRHA438_Chr17g0804311 [Helianthus annuus]